MRRTRAAKRAARRLGAAQSRHDAVERIDAAMQQRAEASDRAFGDALEVWKRKQKPLRGPSTS